MELDLPEGTTPEVAELFMKPEVLAVVEHHNKGLSAKKQELLDQLSLTKKDIAELGGLDSIKARLQAAADAERAAKSKADNEAMKSKDIDSVNKAWQEKLDAANAKILQYEQARIQSTVNAQLTKALAEDADALDVLEPFLLKRIKTEIDGSGEIAIKVLAANGGPLLTDKGEGTLKDLVTQFRDDPKFAPLFRASNKSGSGAKSTNGPVTAENPWLKNTPQYSPTKQAQVYRTDPAKARALAAAAGVKLFE